MSSIEAEWRKHFVAYEDALTSFYALQEDTKRTLEQSAALTSELERLRRLRKPILEVRRQLRASAAVNGRVAEIERELATIELDGVPLEVRDLAASRVAPNDTLLELSFRADAASMPRFVKLTEPVRIGFPFGDSSFVAACRLIRFRMIRDEFAFRFATVDPSAADPFPR